MYCACNALISSAIMITEFAYFKFIIVQYCTHTHKRKDNYNVKMNS
jgi:hypothetical protein